MKLKMNHKMPDLPPTLPTLCIFRKKLECPNENTSNWLFVQHKWTIYFSHFLCGRNRVWFTCSIRPMYIYTPFLRRSTCSHHLKKLIVTQSLQCKENVKKKLQKRTAELSAPSEIIHCCETLGNCFLRFPSPNVKSLIIFTWRCHWINRLV